MNEEVKKQEFWNYQTPFYIFDTDVLAERIRKIRSVIGSREEVCYAMKANPFLTGALIQLTDSFEVCSPGEFRICERAGVPMEKIIMSGVYKNPEDIFRAVKTYEGKGVYTAESPVQWELLKRCSEECGVVLRVLLRLSAGSQFGMDEEAIRKIVSERMSAPNLEIEGLQLFSGTQKKSSKKYGRELSRLNGFRIELEKEYGWKASRLEYGPGLPVAYFEEEEDSGEELLTLLASELDAVDFDGRVVLEMGRFIAASCGSYVTSVADLKISEGQGYCIVDGGIHHVNYYGQMMAMKKPPIRYLRQTAAETAISGDVAAKKPECQAENSWTVCGSLCTMNDVLVKQYPLSGPAIGDRLVFERTGAYSVTEGISLFLSRPLPQVLLYSEKEGFRVLRKSLPTDVLNYDSAAPEKQAAD